ncbi:hypothetical protein PAMC26577_03960 [Caballeronia sordidicola]|uniref:Uncharacterized protein n=1 Tax=Caballeronia sordidicola TaxID=196367 RepID=A0A242N514_CABSO|nr:hypothetical protein PAMC26577_03960 [Caballeronia sordidicola]
MIILIGRFHPLKKAECKIGSAFHMLLSKRKRSDIHLNRSR